MGIARLSAVGGLRYAGSAAESQSVAVKVTKVSARDTAVFSDTAQDFAAAVKETVEKAEAAVEAAKTDAEKTEDKKSVSEMIKEQTEKINSLFSDKSGKNDRQLISIKLKIRSGRSLSANEAKYLSKYDPDAYSNYRTIEDSRRMWRCQLASCRTKDEVNGMRLSNALSALSAYKKAIKQGGDGSEVAGLNMALEREISSFSQSARFRNLPTSAERDKYYAQLAKARKFEREKQLAQRVNSRNKKKKQVKQPGDGKMTVAQVMNSPLGRKVRNAGKGGSCGVCFSSSSFGSSYNRMDQKG